MHLGKVYLIGAGPGDPELLTLKAVKVLGQAQVILVDDLVNPDILQFTNSNARIIKVGKRGGSRSTPQEIINQQLLDFALHGYQVARVKGGDPLIFGRAGEEIEFLTQAGIEVVIINGITSGLAALSSLGIPLTHRNFAHSATFITGASVHPAGEPDWPSLAKNNATIVIYMGLTKLSYIAKQLLAEGMDASTPAAIIQNVSLPHEHIVLCTLHEIATVVEQENLCSPAVIIIGQVVQGVKTTKDTANFFDLITLCK